MTEFIGTDYVFGSVLGRDDESEAARTIVYVLILSVPGTRWTSENTEKDGSSAT